MEPPGSYDKAWRRDFDRRAAEQSQQAQQAIEDRQQAQQAAALHESGVASYRKRTGALVRNWLIAAVAAFVLGLVFAGIGAKMNSPDLNGQTPGAWMLILGGILIAAALITAVVVVVTAAVRYNNAERLSRQKGNPVPWIATLLASVASVVTGAAVIVTQSGQGGPAGKSATNVGIVFIVTGLLGALAWLVAGFLHVIRPQREAYKRWMASLTPQQRTAVYAAQAAALMAAHEGLKHSNQQARERRAGAQARRDYMHRFMNATMRHEPFDELPPPGMSGAWGR